MNLFVEGNIYDIGGVNIFRVISFSGFLLVNFLVVFLWNGRGSIWEFYE